MGTLSNQTVFQNPFHPGPFFKINQQIYKKSLGSLSGTFLFLLFIFPSLSYPFDCLISKPFFLIYIYRLINENTNEINLIKIVNVRKRSIHMD